ncbi:GGDEF domain-containing phosphodiesterase [Priestia megaterium]|uniref:putative bifunctional diguanylate cyclase/phosphodiesterase n=1 Tax=Priestia megaterium TaxID=1404 RepID=UPI002D7F9A38|nr:GGDEF domain-containing phosphodiesterase [Priestia megaterium]MEB4870193.1 GGDEF domain-containing phosphodiesterase [Priestia megaterium]
MDKLNKKINDKHTNLPEFALFNDRLNLTLSFSRRYQMSTAICYLRVILPKELTDNKENQIETFIMNNVFSRLNGSIRDVDTIIKVNRTDFIISIVDITEDDCGLICERIISYISDIYKIGSNHFTISSSIGVCMFPYGSKHLQELQVISKIQMYEALNTGINQFSIYKGIFNDIAYRKVLIESDLPYAIKKKQLYIEYQPQFHLSEGKVTGFESLIRWNHPRLGEISPVEFLPYLETIGMLNDIFFLVFEEVCKNIANEPSRDIKYSINLSVNQLLLPNLVQDLEKIINKYSIPTTQISLEITEDIQIYTVKEVKEKLHLLKKIGFTIALDDFGNGYFSFSDFIELPIDFIKLDRDFVLSLVKNKKYKDIISSIVVMAHNLGLQVIVEGVEDYNQFQDWYKLNCDIIQGYFISKPKPYTALLGSIKAIELRVNSSID